MGMLLRGPDSAASLLRDGGEFDRDGSLAEAPLFLGLSVEQLDALVASSSSLRIRRQQVVFSAGETLVHLYMVRAGSFKLIRHSEEGKELIVALARRGECFGALAEPVESRTRAQTIEESSVLVIPLAAVRRTLGQNPSFAIRLLQHSQERHEAIETAATRLAFEAVPERLAHLLLEVSNPSSGELEIPLNQTELANLIGSSRETVCSILNQFRRQGLLQANDGRLRIADREALGKMK